MAFPHHINLFNSIIRLLYSMCFALSGHVQVYLSLRIFVDRPFEIWVFSGLVPEELVPVDVVVVLKSLILWL